MNATVGIDDQPGIGKEFVPDLKFHKSISRSAEGDLTITIGKVSVFMTGLTGSQKSLLSERYGVFCSSGNNGTGADFRIEVKAAGRDSFLRVAEPGASEYYRVRTSLEEESLLATSYEWAGWFDRGAGQGGLTLASMTDTDPRAFDRGVENFLRVLYSHLVVERGGFLLHAAGLVREGKAFLFFGPSGSGKTTVTTMSPEATILSDDLTLITRDENGGYGASSVPFRGAFAPRPESNNVYSIAGFFRLIQDKSDFLEPMSGARAVGELVGSLPFIMERPEMTGLVMDSVASVTSGAPVFRLHFRRDRAFWEMLRSEGFLASDRPSVDDFSGIRGIK